MGVGCDCCMPNTNRPPRDAGSFPENPPYVRAYVRERNIPGPSGITHLGGRGACSKAPLRQWAVRAPRLRTDYIWRICLLEHRRDEKGDSCQMAIRLGLGVRPSCKTVSRSTGEKTGWRHVERACGQPPWCEDAGKQYTPLRLPAVPLYPLF